MYTIDALEACIPLGNQGEVGATEIEFDVSAWEALHPGLSVAANPGVSDGLWLTYTRCGETTVYPETAAQLSILTVDGDIILTWAPSEAVLDIAGNGTVVIHLTDTGVEKRSVMTAIYVAPGHAAAGTPPEPLDDYIEKWGAVDLTVTEQEPGNDATGTITQDSTGTHISLALPTDMTKWADVDAIVTESVPGTSPTVAVTQDEDGTHFAFDLPTDLTADATATTLDTGEPATASVTQDETGAHFEFGLPRGLQGIQGIKGDTGASIDSAAFDNDDIVFVKDDANKVTLIGAKTTLTGPQGVSAYLHIKYADAEPTQNADMIDTPSVWMGIYSGVSPTAPTDYTDYTWNRVRSSPMPLTWAEFRGAVRDGTIDKYFAVGDQFNVAKGATNLVFDIVDIGSSSRNTTANGNAPTDPDYFTQFPNAKPVTLLMHDVIYGVMFDNSEANYQITTEIASGAKCNISLESNTIAAATYNFTAPSALVVGGRLRINTAVQLQYYATPTSAPVNIAMEAGEADAEYISIAGSLSAQNHKQRVSYGSNKYTESAIRQWLNAGGDAGSFWTSKSNYDLAPTWHSTLAGFRNGLDADFLAAIGETTREVELNTVTDGGGQATISDKIFLPSRMEIYGSVETAGHKGLQYQAYVGLADIDKIKYDTTALSTARLWWLRSPTAAYARYARIVLNTTGTLSSDNAYAGAGVAAACVIL